MRSKKCHRCHQAQSVGNRKITRNSSRRTNFQLRSQLTVLHLELSISDWRRERTPHQCERRLHALHYTQQSSQQTPLQAQPTYNDFLWKIIERKIKRQQLFRFLERFNSFLYHYLTWIWKVTKTDGSDRSKSDNDLFAWRMELCAFVIHYKTDTLPIYQFIWNNQFFSNKFGLLLEKSLY